MPCKLCGVTGHNAKTCINDESLATLFARIELASSSVKQRKRKSKTKSKNKTKSERERVMTMEMADTANEETKKKLMTEDTGKVFEKAICLKYGIEYQGKYKYGDERANAIQPLLENLPNAFPSCVHTAEKGSQYDFTSVDGKSYLSAKTCKRGKGKVAPQQFGQCTLQKLWDKMGWEMCDKEGQRRKIQENVRQLMPLFEEFTFDCDVVYYHEKKQCVKYIKKLGPIDWEKEEFKWTKTWDKWSNSTTLKVKRGDKFISIFEFQIHSSGRSNMCNRWSMENVLEAFADKFDVNTWQ